MPNLKRNSRFHLTYSGPHLTQEVDCPAPKVLDSKTQRLENLDVTLRCVPTLQLEKGPEKQEENLDVFAVFAEKCLLSLKLLQQSGMAGLLSWALIQVTTIWIYTK